MSTDFQVFERFAKHDKNAVKVNGQNAVIYTRVSTKEQAETNMSLETQRKGCELYASRNNYQVLAFFGGTHESAKTDERKQFAKMIEYAKRHKAGYIIVYSLERFSRNDNAIWVARQLREAGIQIVSVTQPIDATNPSGIFQQNILFLFGQYDNDLRKQKCTAGMKEKLSRGYWLGRQPFGYDRINVNGECRTVVNQKGELLRKAFYWKAEEGTSSQEIIERLKAQGITLYKQQLSKMLRNPFYCGLIVNSMLDGKIVEGLHEPLVSQELFLRANGMLSKNNQKYKHKKENEALPLKRFVKCEECGTSFAGYLVKKKGLYYYKCNRKGCKCNKSAKELHGMFKDLLKRYSFDER
nr:recombinase family protein [Bacteroidota bacterium]